MATFMPALMNYALREQIDPASAAEYAKTPEYIGAKTAKDQEVLTKTGALGLAGGLVAGGGLGLFGGAAGAGGAVGGEAAGAIGLGNGISAAPGAGALLGAGAPEAGYALGTGLTPGVASEVGGALGSGIGAGAVGSLGLLSGAYPTLAASVPGVASAGTGATGTAPLGGGISAPSGGASLGAGAATAPAAGGAAGPAAAATTTGAGLSFTDSLMKQMKDNALALGLMGAGTAASLSAGRPQIPNQQQLQGLGTEASGVAKQLIGQYQSGALNPNQQASLDQLTQNTKNQLRQYFASIGQGDSTAAAQAMAQVDQTALGMKQQMLDTALQQGLSAIGVAQGPLNTIAQYQLGQDAQLRQAFGNFAGGVGQLFGRNSGVPQPTKPVTSVGAQQPVSSVQSQSPQLG